MNEIMDNKILKQDVVAITATMDASTEIFSEVFYSNVQTEVEAFLYVADSSKITGNLTVKTYGSYDGTTFFVQGSTRIAASTGAKTVYATAKFAPYFKVSVFTDAGETLASGHGAYVDIVIIEKNIGYKRDFTQKEFVAGQTTANTTTIDIDGLLQSVTFGVYAKPSATLSDLDFAVSTSMDGTTWYQLTTVSNKASGDLPYSLTITEGLLKYVKVVPSAVAGGNVWTYLNGVGY